MPESLDPLKPPYFDKVLAEDGTLSKTWLNYLIQGFIKVMNGAVNLVAGTPGRILVTGTQTNPIINIDPAYVASAAQGGTGQSSYLLGDTLYASTPTTLSKLAGVTTARRSYLGQFGTGTVSAAPEWVLDPVFDIRDYVRPGDADSTQSMTRAAAALQSAGRGTLYFPPATYSIFGGTTGSPTICAFSNLLDGVRISAVGAVFLNTRTFVGFEKGIIFSFTGCRNICIDPIEFDTTIPLPVLPNVAGTYKNVGFDGIWLFSNSENGGCYGFDAPEIKARGVRSVFACAAASTDPEYYKSRGINIGTVQTDTCAYGVNCQFSGDDIWIGSIKSRKPHRSFFVYGIKNFDVRIHSEGNDADDCLLAMYEDGHLIGGRVEYTNYYYTGYPDAQSAAPGVSLAFADETAGLIANINIKINMKWGASGYPGIGLHLYKLDNLGGYDTLPRGHRLSNVTVTGIFEGNPGPGNSPPITSSGTWAAGDYINGFSLENVRMNGTASSTMTFLASADGPISLKNVYSDAAIYLGENPLGTRVTCINVTAPHLTAATSNTGYHDYYGCIFTDGSLQSIINKNFDAKCQKAGYLQPDAQLTLGVYSTTNTSPSKLFLSDAAGTSPVDTTDTPIDNRIGASTGAVTRNASASVAQVSHATNFADLQHILSTANNANSHNVAMAILQDGSISLRYQAGPVTANTLLSSQLLNLSTTVLATALQAIFSKTGGGPAAAVIVSAAAPAVALQQTGAAADNKIWDFLSTSEQLQGRAVNDANSVSGKWVIVDRTGTVIDQVDFPGTMVTAHDLKLKTAGDGLYIKEGSNATMGLATLVAGVAVVSTTKVTANSRIFLTRQTVAGTPGTSVDVTARTAGTSFTITAAGSILDTSTVAWQILEPA